MRRHMTPRAFSGPSVGPSTPHPHGRPMPRMHRWFTDPRRQRAIVTNGALAATGVLAACRGEPNASPAILAAEVAAAGSSSAVDPGQSRPAAGDTSTVHAGARRESAALRVRLLRVADSVAARSGIPFLAPLYLVGIPDDDSTFVTVRLASAAGYDIVFGSREGCSGANACRTGRVTGRPVARGTRLPAGEHVTVPNVGPAVFQPSVCGADCSDAVLTWDRGAVRYAVGLHAGEREDVRMMARSVMQLAPAPR